MTGQVLRRRVEDDVRAEDQRPLERRRGERVVDDDERPSAALGHPARDRRDDRRDVDDLEMRVRRRLEPDQPGAIGQRLPQRVLAGRHVHVSRVDAGAAPDLLEVSVRPAVDVVADDDLVARAGELGDRRGHRRSRGERDPVGAALERGDRALEALARRVLRARVLVAAARPADPVLGEGRGLVDRRRDGPGQLVGFGAGVDGQRVEGGPRRWPASRRGRTRAPRHRRRPAGSRPGGSRSRGRPRATRRCRARPTRGTARRPASAPSRTSPGPPRWRHPGGDTPARPGSRSRPGPRRPGGSWKPTDPTIRRIPSGSVRTIPRPSHGWAAGSISRSWMRYWRNASSSSG